MPRKIIGEGSYGCVHKPSIHCKTPPKPNFTYKNYVSKIMKTKNARDELNEFLTIKRFDPNDEYHLGEPILCSPDLTDESTKKDIAKCKRIKLSNDQDEYSLLLVKYGGPDLKELCKNHLTKYLETNKEEKVDTFLLEIHHLLRGIKFFKDNGLVHNDIKPQNILFDPKTHKFKYIDFGLMQTKETILNSSKNNNNYLGIFHWSYPFDCGFMNKNNFNRYKNLTSGERFKLRVELIDMIVYNNLKNTFNLPLKHPESFEILFTYINPDDTAVTLSDQENYIADFFDGFDELISKNSYSSVLERITNSIDIYGLGFTLQYIINCFKRHNGLELSTFNQLSTFFKKMYDFNPLNRVIDIDVLIDEYENILLDIGVLTRLDKRFENHLLVNRTTATNKSTNKAKTKRKINPPKDCPPNKELNPITARCVNKCKPGFYRNAQFKCRKSVPMSKSHKSVIEENEPIDFSVKCPPNKELNPKTTRCVNKCKPGFYRNPDFKCRKTRKIKSKSNSHKSIII